MSSGAVLLPRKFHYQESSYREMVMEYQFLGLLLPEYWRRNFPNRIEVSKPEVDNTGYDLILEASGIIRHVQLKSSLGKARVVPVNCLLEEKPSGCVIYLEINEHLAIQGFRWFGREPGTPMLSVSTFPHQSGKRYNLAIGKMERVGSILELLKKLFG